ncbi:SDR family NAD(P)-dependent oxidoreductase [Cohnella yongneupensis]|uniref:SDR family NAD(P)-dependent oxidoreductase n=1 Tax=Cohnella yongneupensis TaxID=425006 RepID=A0ABW0R0X2_9BACL
MHVFKDKVCIVTGSASGIGLEIVKQLSEYGATVIIADVNMEEAIKVAKEINDRGGKAEAAYVDVTDSGSVEALVNGAADRYGRLDYMFNNAGITVIGDFRDLPLAEIKKVLDINLNGVLHGSHYAYQVMARQGFGHIVNTASGYGLTPGPTHSPYVTSKFGVVGLSECLRYEGADLGIKVSTVCPGYIRTSLVENVRTYNADPKEIVSGIPVKLVEPDNAVRIILREVSRNRAIIKFPSYVGVLTFLYRFMPSLFKRHALKEIRRFRSIRNAGAGKKLSEEAQV